LFGKRRKEGSQDARYSRSYPTNLTYAESVHSFLNILTIS